MSKCHNILPTSESIFVSSVGKIESAGIKSEVFAQAISLWVTVMQKLYPHTQWFSMKMLFCVFKVMSTYSNVLQ